MFLVLFLKNENIMEGLLLQEWTLSINVAKNGSNKRNNIRGRKTKALLSTERVSPFQ